MLRRTLPALLVPALALAQAPSEAPLPGPTEQVRVHLAQFDVVVRDASGRMVRGLGQADFRVFEGDREVELVAVDEWGPPAPERAPATAAAPAPPAPAAPPSPAPEVAAPRNEPRTIAVLFDALDPTSALRFHQAKRAAKQFVRSTMRPGDLVSIWKLDMALRPVTGFSADPASVNEGIDSVAWMPPSTLDQDITEQVLAYRSRAGASRVPTRLGRQALLHGQALDWQRDHVYEQLQVLAQSFQDMPGRKVVVLLSAGFAMTSPGDFTRHQGGFTEEFRRLLKALAAQGISVYSIDIGDDTSLSDASQGVNWRDAAGKIGLEESVLADIGLDRLGSASAPARREVLGVLAAETGGRLLTHADLDEALAIVAEEATFFYRLSCRVPEGDDPGRYRPMTIRVSRPGVKVSARRGRYADVVPGASTAAAKAEIRESLAHHRILPVRGASLVLPPGPDGLHPVAVVVEVIGPVEFPPTPEGGAEVGLDFQVVARAGEDVIARQPRTLQARVRPEGVTALRKAFRLEGRLNLRPGAYVVQANVRLDRPPQFATWSAPVVVAGPEGTGPTFSSLLLAPGPADASPLLLASAAEDGTPDPLGLAGGRILPATRLEHAAPGPLTAVFWLRGVTTTQAGQPRLELSVAIRDAAGAEVAAPSRLALFRPDGRGGHHGIVEVDLSRVPEGTYEIELVGRDKEAIAAPARVRSTFQVVPAAATSSPASAGPGSPGSPPPGGSSGPARGPAPAS